jgi:hypothetical protein
MVRQNLKLVTFQVGGMEHIGLLKGGKVVDMETCHNSYISETDKSTLATHANFSDMVTFLKGGEAAIELAEELETYSSGKLGVGGEFTGPKGEKVVYNEAEVKLKSPLMPSKLLLMGGIYPTHSGVSRPAGMAHKITREELVNEVLDGRVIQRPTAILRRLRPITS